MTDSFPNVMRIRITAGKLEFERVQNSSHVIRFMSGMVFSNTAITLQWYENISVNKRDSMKKQQNRDLEEDIMENSKVFAMKLSKAYPLLVLKAEKKNRTKQEVDEIICWLTGYDKAGLEKKLQEDVDYGTFFKKAPHMNPNCVQIKGKICGIRVEEITDPLMHKIRCLDKLIDELAKGKPMEKILHYGSST